jgi:hypothetical protein
MGKKAPGPVAVHQALGILTPSAGGGEEDLAFGSARVLNFDAEQAPFPPPQSESFWERRAKSEAQLVPATSAAPHAAPVPALVLPVPLEAHQVARSPTSQSIDSQAQVSRTSFIIGKRAPDLGSGAPQAGLVGGADSAAGAKPEDLLSARVPASQHPPLPASNSFTYLLADHQYAKLAEQIPY